MIVNIISAIWFCSIKAKFDTQFLGLLERKASIIGLIVTCNGKIGSKCAMVLIIKE